MTDPIQAPEETFEHQLVTEYEKNPIYLLEAFLQGIVEANKTEEGKSIFPGGLVLEHQTPSRTPAMILEIPRDIDKNPKTNSQLYDEMKYSAYLHVVVQGTKPLRSAIDVDNLCKFIRLKIKEAEVTRSLAGIKRITCGNTSFYGVEDETHGIISVAGRMNIEWVVMEDYEELAPLVEHLHVRAFDWDKEEQLREIITDAPVVEPPVEEEEGEPE